ncbi:SWIM zinc finger family protein [Oceanospirillum sediminis]|uniref:SWIM zinc finger family protein n=1 Tax=Oceanospirillum sediminis TaxID=2760088 RepID=A0A839IQ65_9GAMM|nr:SWIM zinc finger family protein [Oceanospirillum sediminis]MBB1487643.1 SWIM zinc finger family protein [Oceanospirillum sediminis]
MFSVEEIQSRAETNSLSRGEALYRQDKVSVMHQTDTTIKATVTGQHKYVVTLTATDQGIKNLCTCPAASYQDFCKHCVAVALTAIHGAATDQPAQKAKNNRKIVEEQQLREFLLNKSPEELTELLVGYITRIPEEWDKWQLNIKLANGDLPVSEIKKMITKALPSRTIHQWRKVGDYFSKAEAQFDYLFQLISTMKPQGQWSLILHALKRLNKVLERIDDSGGYRFVLEEQLIHKLTALFNQLNWNDEKKAQWLFQHLDQSDMNVFPNVPDDFSPSDSVLEIFREQCEHQLKELAVQRPVVSQSDRHFDYFWKLSRYGKPLIDKAIADNNWREHCRLLGLTASYSFDMLKACQICLDNNEPFDAEDWLLKAKKLCCSEREEEECRQYEVKVKFALDEDQAAWALAWQIFEQNPGFNAFRKLQKLEQQTGHIQEDLAEKAEAILLKACMPSNQENPEFISPLLSDDVLSLYLELNQLDKARAWAKQHKAYHNNLISLANLIVSQHPEESENLYYRVLTSIISQTNNTAYQDAIALLKKLELILQKHNSSMMPLQSLIQTLSQECKQKKNMITLLKKQFAQYFPG